MCVSCDYGIEFSMIFKQSSVSSLMACVATVVGLSLKGKVFVVTGGSSGIGYGTARLLLDEGSKAYITGRNRETLETSVAKLGMGAIGVLADASIVDDSVLLARTIERNGDLLDGIFVNAGKCRIAPFDRVDEAQFDGVVNTNFKGAFFTIQKLLTVLRDGSSVVLNGSVDAKIGMSQSSVYSASKAALNSLAKTLSRDLLPRKIRVNVVNPGPIDTPLFGKLGVPEADVPDLLHRQVPAGRPGQVEEIASYVAFLLSERSSYIIGTELTIDGGLSQL